jgi:hypothetical protein
MGKGKGNGSTRRKPAQVPLGSNLGLRVANAYELSVRGSYSSISEINYSYIAITTTVCVV